MKAGNTTLTNKRPYLTANPHSTQAAQYTAAVSLLGLIKYKQI